MIIYGEGCFNSKLQARRTVERYSKYRSSIHFVAIDLDIALSAKQQEFVKEYYKGYIPHVLVLDGHGKPALQPIRRGRYQPDRDHFQKRAAPLTRIALESTLRSQN